MGGPPWFLAESMDVGEHPMGALPQGRAVFGLIDNIICLDN